MKFVRVAQNLRLLALGAVISASLFEPSLAQTTIAGNPSSNSPDVGAAYLAQSFTAGSSGSYYNRVTYSFLTNTGANLANGKLYLFTSVYNGTPSGLATATGVFGSATAANNVYSFASGLTLTGGQTYYAYADTSQNADYTNVPSGGGGSFTTSATSMYTDGAGGFNNAYTVRAFAAATPEPATWSLMILGFGVVGGTLRRQKRRMTAVA